MFFSRLEVMGFEEEDNRGKVPFSSLHTDTCYLRDLSLLILIMVIYSLSGFANGTDTLFSPFSILYTLEGSHYAQPTIMRYRES